MTNQNKFILGLLTVAITSTVNASGNGNESCTSCVSPCGPSPVVVCSDSIEKNYVTREELSLQIKGLERSLKTKNSLSQNGNDNLKYLISKIEDNFKYLITLAVALISVVVSILGIGTPILLKLINKGLEKAKKEAADELEKSHEHLLRISRQTIATTIYARLSGHCINLYKDIDRSKAKNNDLYESYLEIAIDISGDGYLDACSLIENKKLKENDELYRISVNNRVFYLASRANEEDKKEVIEPLKRLEKILLECDYLTSPNWYDYQDTLAWAMLKLGYKSTDETKNAVQELFENQRISTEWKIKTKKKYEDYGRERDKTLPKLITLNIPSS